MKLQCILFCFEFRKADHILLYKVLIFKTSDLQFGFKLQSFTAKCTFALMETVNYFQQNKSHVYVLLLDATKAFDKINYVILFNLLMDQGMNPLLIRCLLYVDLYFYIH